MTFCFSSISEEAIEDVEGPSDAAADPEELAKDQESGGEKEQSKWTGSVCGPPAPDTSPLQVGGRRVREQMKSFIYPEKRSVLCSGRRIWVLLS